MMHPPRSLAAPARRRKAAALLTGCAAGAVLAATPQAASAQAFAATPTVVSGTPTFTDAANATRIGLVNAETVINWTPTDTAGTGTINFLPAGNTATFQGAADFTVLNRILPVDTKGNPTARAVAFNGTVDSLVGFRSPLQGGNVWFYSPTGIIVGNGAKFTVGGLVLTTNDILFGPANTGGSELYGPGNTVLFRGPAGSTGFVDVQAGSAINAASYVALVAPRVTQGGNVTANGPIGYVGAEQADISINAGLFDISIGVGTTDANGVVHTGTTTGPASTSAGDVQQIMMVAMPKATALTMLLSGSIGYAPAGSAANEGSSVVLSAGYSTPVPAAESPAALGNIAIDNAIFQNATNAYATNDLKVTASAGPVGFGADAFLFAQHAVDFTLGSGESVSATGDLTVNAGKDGAGGTIDVTLGSKASLNVGGELALNAQSYAIPYASSFPLAGTGGRITVDANGGSISAASMVADASALGNFGGLAGGNATAGAVSLTARNGGSIAATDINLYADAEGGDSDSTAGNARGGSIVLVGQGGGLNFSNVMLEARALGGTGSAVSGAATGGKASVSLTGGTYTWKSLAVDTSALSSIDGGTAGAKGNSAAGRADAISLSLGGTADLTVSGDIDLTSDALATPGLAGAAAQGGGIATSVGAGASLTFTDFNATANADVSYPAILAAAPVTTPDATGGRIDFDVGGTVNGSTLSLTADGSTIGASSAAGTARGGTVDALVSNGGNLKLSIISGVATLDLSASGHGAIGQSAANAVGGSATLTLDDGTVDVGGTISVAAQGLANDIAFFHPSGTNPVGFSATGGTAAVKLLPGVAGTASLTASSLTLNAGGNASTPAFFYPGGEFGPAGVYSGPLAANGGKGTGGAATLSLGAGNLTITDVSVSANGSGGISGSSGTGTRYQSGDGVGGTAGVTVGGGLGTITGLSVSADGLGGGGTVAGGGALSALSGDGFGGNASLAISGGALQATTLTIDANGTGGEGGGDDSGNPATDGGNGTGGTADLISTAGGTGLLTSPSVNVRAQGIGGDGGFSTGVSGNGGNGFGGTAAADLSDGALTLGPLLIGAQGLGGNVAAGSVSVSGGEGSGGVARFELDDSATGPSGSRTIDGLQINASGTGGTGTAGTAQSDAGLALLALDAVGPLTINGNLRVSVIGTRSAVGDGFTASFSGTPVQVTGNTTIDTTRDATITSTTPLQTAGNLSITARRLSGTGQLTTGGSATITADRGISLDKLVAGTTTSLQALNGAILVATDLESGGDVSALGRSIDITSLGALNFTTAQATAGDLRIATHGNLSMTGGSATGNVDLSSATGSFSTPGTISGGGNVSIAGQTGVTAPTVVSGGTTHLAANNGAVAIDSLTSAGAVTAAGRAVNITSPGALTFTSANATAGNLHIATAGDLALADGSASGTVDLTSSGGSISSIGLIASGSDFSATGANGVNFALLSSGGTTTLHAPGGAVVVTTDLESAGLVDASGASVDITSLGALSFSNAQATSGDLRIATQGNLTMPGGSATGNVDLSSATGSFSTPGTISGGGNVSIAGRNGLTAPTVISGGTTHLAASNGAIAVDSLTSAGAVTAAGRSVDITSPGALTFTSANATAGNLHIATAGNLALADGSASGTVDLTSSGGRISSTGLIASGSDFSAIGATGLAFTSLFSGGTTTLRAPGGAVVVTTDLESAGSVDATARSIDISSFADLSFSHAQATVGSLLVSSTGNLSFAGANATGAIGLASGGFITATGPVAAGGNVNVMALGGLAFGSLTSGGTSALDGGLGPVTVTDLISPGAVTAFGDSLDISSSGALDVASFGAGFGPVRIATVGNLTIGDGTASADVALSSASGALKSTGLLTTNGNLSLSGDLGLVAQSLSAGGRIDLSAPNGAITVADLATPASASATGRSIDITSAGPLTLTSAAATAGDLTLASGQLTATGPSSATGNVLIDGGNGISLGSLSAGGTTGLTSGGAIQVADLRSVGTVTATGLSIDIASSGGLTFGSAQTTAGALAVATQGDLRIADGDAAGNANLSSANGALVVDNLVAGGQVTATGRAVTVGSTGSLAFANAQATAGKLSISATGDLSFDRASASGAIGISSSSGSLRATGPVTAGGPVDLSAANGIAFGALASGGTTQLNAGAGALTVASLTSPGDVTAVGASIDIASPGALTFTGFSANGGAANVSTVGNLVLGDATVAGALALASVSGAVSSSGTVSAGSEVSVNGHAGVDFGHLASGGTTSLTSTAGPVHVADLSSAGLVSVDGASIDIGSAGELRFDTVQTLGTASIVAAGDLGFGAIFAGSTLTLNSTGGSITTTGDVVGGFTQLSSLTGIALGGDLQVAGSLSVDTRGALLVNGNATMDDASIVADGGITMGHLQTGELTRLNAVNGNILVGDLDTGGRVSAIGLRVDIASTGSLNFDLARATRGNLAIRTGGNLNAQGLFAAQNMNLHAGGTFALFGQATGVNITAVSDDVAIADGAQLGLRGTTSQVRLFNGDSSRETFIGGGPQTSGYSLDGAEVARLQADSGITLGITPTLALGTSHVTVGSLALSFGTGGNIGSKGTLEITTPGEVSIVGDVALTTGNADDRFVIDPSRVELATDTGSIAMLDAGGNPLGRLQITGDTVAVATADTLAQIRSMSDVTSISALLDVAGGKANPVRAGTIAFDVIDGLFIQNSGVSPAFGARRGFAADALDITTASAATRIAINGVIFQNGVPVAGLATTPLVTINGVAAARGGQFDPESTVNGCIIGSVCNVLGPPTNDDLNPPVTPDNPSAGGISSALVQLEDNQPLISPPLVDEPITGVGNDDLWLLQCDPKKEGCPQQDNAQ